MKIAVTAGKGGTGKTTVATNLALALSQTQKVQLLDCDVEEPDAHIFLDPGFDHQEPVYMKRPNVNPEACNQCGRCAEMCRFNAIAVVGGKATVFPELCHGCGLCKLVCPQGAITEEDHQIGSIEWGWKGNLNFLQGQLTVGDPVAPPIIHALKEKIDPAITSILDSPPGAACPAVETLQGADFALLVTEPTPFGLHDLKIAIEVCKKLGIKHGVVINRYGIGNTDIEGFCEERNIPVLLTIPDSREIAELYADGIPFTREIPGWGDKFTSLVADIQQQTIGEKV